jgi:hypothetical protein
MDRNYPSYRMMAELSHRQLADIRQRGLPEKITVRFVRVMLTTGEAEILVSSLLDEHVYPSADFAEL